MSRFDRVNRAVLRHFRETGPVTIIRDGEPDLEVSAVYDKRHFEGDVSGAVFASVTEITVAVADSEAGEVVQEDRVSVRGETYKVTDTRSDATGWTVLVLEATA